MTAPAVAVTEREVRQSIRRVIDHAESIWDEWAWQVENKTWNVLGYASWDEMRRAEYGGLTSITAPREERPELVSRFRNAGLTQRQTAETLGVTKRTVERDENPHQLRSTNVDIADVIDAEVVEDDYVTDQADLHAAPELPDEGAATPRDSGDAEPSEDEGLSLPSPSSRSVTGLDGKQYARPEPQTPRRAPLPDAFWRATYDLTKVTERLGRLTQDDRFPQNAEKVATANRSDLLRASDLLHQVIDSIPEI